MLMVDGYKLGHHCQYPEGMDYLFSNFTARSDSHFKKIAVKKYMDGKVVVFGTTAVVKYLEKVWEDNFFSKNKKEVVGEFVNIVRIFLQDPTFSAEHVEELHDHGSLPIIFSTLPEGTLCPIGVPFFTIENVGSEFAWLVNYLETQLSNMLWKPITSATIARHYKVILNDFYNKTCDNKLGMDYMIHDFSMRGLGYIMDAIFTGMAHMTCFNGSDNLPAIIGVRDYYNHDAGKDFLVGGVPATEHSVTSSNIRTYVELEGIDNLTAEKKTIEYLIGKYPTGFLSYVSDTYDYFGVLTDVLPALKDKLMARDGKFVVRPDSGDPLEIVCGKVKEVTPNELIKMIGICVGDKVSVTVDAGKVYYKVAPENNEYGYTIGYKFVEFDPTPEDKGTLELLWETFGGTINEKGYRVLDSHIGLIYGDSITPQRMYEILKRMEEMGFAASNVVFGVGSFTYQYTTRDTFGMAMKATYCEVNGKPIKLFKDPKTGDGSKKSAKGMLVVQDGVLKDDMNFNEFLDQSTDLKIIGARSSPDFTTIRNRINESIENY